MPFERARNSGKIILNNGRFELMPAQTSMVFCYFAYSLFRFAFKESNNNNNNKNNMTYRGKHNFIFH